MAYNNRFCNEKVGCGLFNSLLNANILPELHYPKYKFLGPFTNLELRLNRGDKPINPLDEAARDHDIFYSQHKDSKTRHIADEILENKAWNRVLSKDGDIPEKVAAYLTTNAMKLKRKIGMGMKSSDAKRRRNSKKKKDKKSQTGCSLNFSAIVKKARKAVKSVGKAEDLKKVAKIALKAIHHPRKVIKTAIKHPRIIPIPKVGGALPLIPILAGISSLGSIASGASSIVKAVRDIIEAKRQLSGGNKEGRKSVGNGMFLAPHRKGYGLFLAPKNW